MRWLVRRLIRWSIGQFVGLSLRTIVELQLQVMFFSLSVIFEETQVFLNGVLAGRLVS